MSTDCWDQDLYASPSPQTEAPAPDPATAAETAIEVIAAPVKLAEEILDPETTKLPMGLAILGACVVAVMWAISVDSKGK